MVDEPGNIRTKVLDSAENRQKCICRLCNSYPQDCKGEILYCGKISSKCDIKPKTCLCNRCPVYKEYKLQGLYYCDKSTPNDSTILIRKKGSQEDPLLYEKLVNIKEESTHGKSIKGSMGSLKKFHYTLDDIYFVPAQVNKIPLNLDEEVKTRVTIGPRAQKPFTVSSPILISGMSFGAVSKKVKLIIAETSAELQIGYNSGEGGLITEENDNYEECRILQYATSRYGINEDLLKSASAVEIRFGQGAYPGKGSYLPEKKISEEIAESRGLNPGEASYSPAHHQDITDHEKLKEKISWLRKITEGSPIGAKIGCGDVKSDVKVLAKAGIDFIALDGFGGGTGATDIYIRDNVGIPVFTALPIAYDTLKEMDLKNKISLIAGGGLRTSADFAKCLALGADAVYIGTAALIAINCQQYRVCYSGLCPTGVTTQDPKLMNQLDFNQGKSKLANFMNLNTSEIANLCRVMGKNDVNDLNLDDLITGRLDLSLLTGVKWLNGKTAQDILQFLVK